MREILKKINIFNVSNTFIKTSEQWLSCLLSVLMKQTYNMVFFPCVHREPTNRILHQTLGLTAVRCVCGSVPVQRLRLLADDVTFSATKLSHFKDLN